MPERPHIPGLRQAIAIYRLTLPAAAVCGLLAAGAALARLGG